MRSCPCIILGFPCHPVQLRITTEFRVHSSREICDLLRLPGSLDPERLPATSRDVKEGGHSDVGDASVGDVKFKRP